MVELRGSATLELFFQSRNSPKHTLTQKIDTVTLVVGYRQVASSWRFPLPLGARGYKMVAPEEPAFGVL
jgi:hypothetical protein